MGMFGFLSGKKKEEPPPADPDLPPSDVKAAPPSKQQIDSLAKGGKYVFTKVEMTKLKARYEVISNSTTGLIDKEVLYSQPEFSCCLAMVMLVTENVIKKAPPAAAPAAPAEAPAAPGAAHAETPQASHPPLDRANTFKRKVNEQLSYEQFLEIYSFLSPKTDADTKCQFLFAALDAAGDGLLEVDDMFRYYQAVLGSNISSTLIRQMAQATLDTVGMNQDDRRARVINFDKFRKVVDHVSLSEKLTIHF